MMIPYVERWLAAEWMTGYGLALGLGHTCCWSCEGSGGKGGMKNTYRFIPVVHPGNALESEGAMVEKPVVKC